jgi:hypothetical protein
VLHRGVRGFCVMMVVVLRKGRSVVRS